MPSPQAPSGKMNMNSKSSNVSTTHGRDVAEQPRYETPRIISYTEEEILQDIGPAQGYNGDIPGVTNSL